MPLSSSLHPIMYWGYSTIAGCAVPVSCSIGSCSGPETPVQVLRQMTTEAADTLTERLAARQGVLSTTLFPALPVLRSLLALGR